MENYSPFHNDDKFKEEIRKPCIYFAYCFHITVITKAITIPIIKIYYGYLIISILGWLTLKRIMTMVSSFQTILKETTPWSYIQNHSRAIAVVNARNIQWFRMVTGIHS